MDKVMNQYGVVTDHGDEWSRHGGNYIRLHVEKTEGKGASSQIPNIPYT